MIKLIRTEKTDKKLTFFFSNGDRQKVYLNEMPEKIEHVFPIDQEEWEFLCRRCGQCCHYRWIDFDGNIHITDEVCKYFRKRDNSCKIYSIRETVPGGCNRLSLNNRLQGLPNSCPYREYLCPGSD